MVPLSQQLAGSAVAPGLREHRAPVNTARRGPLVLATDGASRNGAVVVAAQLIAARLDVPLEVVSVLERTPVYSALVPEVLVPLDPAIDDTRSETRETLVTDYVCRFSGAAAPPRVHVRFGNVAAEISRFAREVSATMIVMGSAPHRRFRHIASGELAAHVLHSAPCPVLAVPPTFWKLPNTVVAAVDFGPASVVAARAALLVVADGGKIVLTHVLPPLVLTEALNDASAADPSAEVQEKFDRLREELRSGAPPGVRIEQRVVTDAPVTGILAAADHLGADLVVVGTHGPGLVERLLLGSVTESVLRRTARPVLASPPPVAGEV